MYRRNQDEEEKSVSFAGEDTGGWDTLMELEDIKEGGKNDSMKDWNPLVEKPVDSSYGKAGSWESWSEVIARVEGVTDEVEPGKVKEIVEGNSKVWTW